MAKALITESPGGGKYGLPVMQPGATQAVTYTTSVQSVAFASDTNIIRVVADADVFLAFGANPTADANSIRVIANTVEYFAVHPGQEVACYDGVS